MEHRCSPRMSANTKILIYKSGLPMAIGRLRNVGRHGIFVKTDYDNVVLNQLLEIEFLSEGAEKFQHKRCRGLIAHRSAEGLGLAIDEDCPTSCELVDQLLARYRRRNAAFSAMRGPIGGSFRAQISR